MKEALKDSAESRRLAGGAALIYLIYYQPPGNCDEK
jgi:hypothetical protein